MNPEIGQRYRWTAPPYAPLPYFTIVPSLVPGYVAYVYSDDDEIQLCLCPVDAFGVGEDSVEPFEASPMSGTESSERNNGNKGE